MAHSLKRKNLPVLCISLSSVFNALLLSSSYVTSHSFRKNLFQSHVAMHHNGSMFTLVRILHFLDKGFPISLGHTEGKVVVGSIKDISPMFVFFNGQHGEFLGSWIELCFSIHISNEWAFDCDMKVNQC